MESRANAVWTGRVFQLDGTGDIRRRRSSDLIISEGRDRGGEQRFWGLTLTVEPLTLSRGSSQHRGGPANLSPHEETLIGDPLHDLLLEPSKRTVSFSIECGHIDVENSKKRVGLVFHPCRFSRCRPREPFSHAELVKRGKVQESFFIDGGNLLHEIVQCVPGPNVSPVL